MKRLLILAALLLSCQSPQPPQPEQMPMAQMAKPTLSQPLQGDVDCTGMVTITDAVVLLNYIFGEQPMPNCNGTVCVVADTGAISDSTQQWIVKRERGQRIEKIFQDGVLIETKLVLERR